MASTVRAHSVSFAFRALNLLCYLGFNTYTRAVYALIQKRKLPTYLMIGDNFMGASYWSPFWDEDARIVFDSHFY
jgi:hypothetical protein